MATSRSDPPGPPAATLPLRERLQRLTAWQVRGRVPVEHNNEAHYALSADRRSWVVKRASLSGPGEILAEAVGHQLAPLLGIPVPTGAWGELDGDLHWFSERRPFVSHYHPAHLANVTPLTDFGRVIVLDVLLINEDRHAGNVLLVHGGDGALTPCFIDFGSAIVGQPGNFARNVHYEPRHANFAPRSVPAEHLRTGADAALAALLALPDHQLTDIIREACEIARLPHDAAGLAAALLERRAVTSVLVSHFLARIGAS
jgi:hypothetical protein